MGSLYDRNQFGEGKINLSIKRLEATVDSSATETIAQESTVRDHVLLTVQAVINGMPLRALVDSGATNSFIDEKLAAPPTIGVYWGLLFFGDGKWRANNLDRGGPKCLCKHW